MSDLTASLEAKKPSIEDVLGPKPKTQTIEDVLGPRDAVEPTVWDGADADEFFSKGVGPGQMLDILGHGFKQGWGAEGLQPLDRRDPNKPNEKGPGERLQDWLFPKYQDDLSNAVKNINQGLLRSTAMATDVMLRRLPTALWTSIMEPAISLGLPRDFAAMPEAFMGSPHIAPFVHAKEAGVFKDQAMTPGEAARIQFAPTGELRPTERVVVPQEAPANVVPPRDVHEAARQAAPELFNEYDEATYRHGELTQQLEEQATARAESERAKELQARIADQLARSGGDVESMSLRLRERYERNQERLDTYLRMDTPEMAAIRRERGAVDERMRELAPDVTAAYAGVRDRFPPPPEPEPIAAEPEPTNVIPFSRAEATPPPAFAEDAAAATQPEIYNLLQRRPSIQADVTRQLIAAGRPEELARNEAALWQAHYEARAARFNGQLGSARDLYESDDPAIRAGEGKNRGQFNIVRNEITLFKDADASTFVHETMHGWLEEMKRDAEHPKAPEGLKADLQTLKNWVGADENFTRAQHEKVARGFERYLMEGVAPSTRLARVFAQFKDWLTSLYNTVGRLKAPINDQVRGVYDRLLSNPKAEPTIAPERIVGQDFDRVHEADAARATPENALRTADEIAAERDQIATILRAEIARARQRARTSGPEKPTPSGAEREAVPGTDVGTTGPVARGEEVAPETTSFSPSGTGFKAEDATVPRSGNEEFEPGNTRTIDKAGNIRLDNLDSPEAVDQAIRDAANYINNSGEQSRRGPLTLGEISDLADETGRDPAFLDRIKIGYAYNAEEILALRRMVVQSSTNAWDWMKRTASGLEEGPLELAKAIAQHEMLVGKLMGVTEEWGRAGNAFRSLSEFNGDINALNQLLKDSTGRSYDDLMQLALTGSKLKTPNQVAKHIANTTWGRAKSVIGFSYVNSLISGLFTHAVYWAGNELRAIQEPFLEVPIAATISAAEAGGRAVLGLPQRDRVYYSEFLPALYGLIAGHVRSWPLMKEAFMENRFIPLPGMKQYGGNSFGVFVDPIGGPVGTALGLPGRAVGALHQMGAGVRYEQSILRQTLRDAIEKGKDPELWPSSISKGASFPTDEMNAIAANQALTEMYMRPTEYNSVLGQLTRVAHNSLIGTILFPFIRIGAGIERSTWLQHTPIGYLARSTRSELLGREGGASFATAQARNVIGVGAIASGVYWAANGNITGFGPADPDQRQAWLVDHEPYSIRVLGLWVPYGGLGAVGNLLRFGADTYEAHHYTDPKNPEDFFKQLAEHYWAAVKHGVFDESFFHDMANVSEVFNDPIKNGARFLYNTAQGFIPYSSFFRQIAHNPLVGIDPYSKEVEGLFDAARNVMPFWSRYVPNRVDMFGVPRPARGIIGERYADDPVAKVLGNIGVKLAPLERHILGVRLMQEQYDDYARTAGILTKQMLDEVILPNIDDFMKGPIGLQRIEIAKQVNSARRQAQAKIIMDSTDTENDITKKATDLKLQALQ